MTFDTTLVLLQTTTNQAWSTTNNSVTSHTRV